MRPISTARQIVILSSQGVEISKIAEEVNIPMSALEIIIRSPLVQFEIARLRHAA